jgi:hypothetical protein
MASAPIHVHALAPDPVGQIPGDRNDEECQNAGGDQPAEQELARDMQDLRAIDKNEGDEDVTRAGFGGFGERAEDDFPGLAADHFQHRRALDPFLLRQALEDRRFENAEPDVEADASHDDAEQKRNAPAPDQKLVAGKPTEKNTAE